MNAIALFLSGEAVTWSSHFMSQGIMVLPLSLLLISLLGFLFMWASSFWGEVAA